MTQNVDTASQWIEGAIRKCTLEKLIEKVTKRSDQHMRGLSAPSVELGKCSGKF